MGERAVLLDAPTVPGAVGPVEGVEEVVTGLDSVLLRLEPGTSADAAVRSFRSALDRAALDRARSAPGDAVLDVPTAFDGEDLALVAEAAGMSPASVVALLTGATLEVAAIGFSPGFPYLRGLPPALARLGRRATPRRAVPAGSVALAAGLAAIYPRASPGGWHLVGRTALVLFDPHRPPYATLAPGDRLRLVAASVPPGPAPEPPPPAGPGGEGPVLIEDPGPACSVQDAGRRGVAHLGVPRAGAADPVALALANLLVGNETGAPALEATLAGPVLSVEVDTFAAVVGDCDVRIDGIGAPTAAALPLRAGQRLALGRSRRGARSYVALRGGLDVARWFASASTDTLAGLGPGRLVAGQRLGLGHPAGSPGGHLRTGADAGHGPVELRVVLGPHTEFFGAGLGAELAGARLRVGGASNRIGVRLAVDPPITRHPGELPSSPMVAGALQVPPDGQPIVLGVDHATLGGYPVAAVVVGADLGRLGQLRPGDEVRLRPVGAPEAQRAADELARTLARAVVGRYPLGPA